MESRERMQRALSHVGIAVFQRLGQRLYHRRRRSSLALVTIALALVFVTSITASAQAQFYQDKTVRIVAGYGAGSVDDARTRLIARYLAKHITVNPNKIVQNMPGAGAMISAN